MNADEFSRTVRTIRLLTGGEDRSSQNGTALPADRFQRATSGETGIGIASLAVPARESSPIFADCNPRVGKTEDCAKTVADL